MRGADRKQSSMLMLMSPETVVPAKHPLRTRPADRLVASGNPPWLAGPTRRSAMELTEGLDSGPGRGRSCARGYHSRHRRDQGDRGSARTRCGHDPGRPPGTARGGAPTRSRHRGQDNGRRRWSWRGRRAPPMRAVRADAVSTPATARLDALGRCAGSLRARGPPPADRSDPGRRPSGNAFDRRPDLRRPGTGETLSYATRRSAAGCGCRQAGSTIARWLAERPSRVAAQYFGESSSMRFAGQCGARRRISSR